MEEGIKFMEVKNVLDKKVVLANSTAKNKDDILKKLAAKLFEEDYISSIDGFIKDVYIREEQGQTGIGNYIAIPHGRSASVKKIGVAIAILDEEIEWETLDGNGVRGVILFAVGNDTKGAEAHLKLLSLFARKLGNDEVIENLLNAKNEDQVVEAFL